MLERTVTITNEKGMHARPAALFVQTASQFESDVFLTRGDLEINGKSIMGVLMLAAETGSSLTLRVSGADEDQVMDQLIALIETGFGED